MVNPLVGIHLSVGEIGVFAFLWALIELLEPTKSRIKRAKIATLIGSIFLFLSWFTGGYYYLSEYGSAIKPLIKAGASPWAHKIVMEIKEHVFLFIPFLALLTHGIIKNKEKELIKGNKNIKKWIILLCALVVLMGFSMAFMGYLISSAARDALALGVVI
tara:strand:+ start:434 stop:913 length:480 start_codon:yes stop_codon:yes gene_type:complete